MPCSNLHTAPFATLLTLLLSFILVSHNLTPHNPLLFLNTNDGKNQGGQGIQVIYCDCQKNMLLRSATTAGTWIAGPECYAVKSAIALARGQLLTPPHHPTRLLPINS